MLSLSADHCLGGSVSKSIKQLQLYNYKEQCQKPLHQHCPISFAGRYAGPSKCLESGHQLS